MSDPQNYTIGWVCALATELQAATLMLDGDEHEPPLALDPSDTNNYVLGSIGRHNIVIACLPDGEYGANAAAVVASNMQRSFPNLRFGLMVGIGGGAPTAKHDIRLGDVVVSSPGGGKGGVLQYDYGKTIQDQDFICTGYLDQPPQTIRTTISSLKRIHERDGPRLDARVEQVLSNKRRKLREKYSRPPASTDNLYDSKVVHPAGANGCDGCHRNPEHLVPRPERDDAEPFEIHYGLIASANQLMKDATMRDNLAEKHDVLCFEMEAAGLMNQFPCLVIRGICDYSDSHKREEWQGFAAMMAASYARDLVQRMVPSTVEAEKTIRAALATVEQATHATQMVVEAVQSGAFAESIRRWLSPADPSTNANHAKTLRHAGTGSWLFKNKVFQEWESGPRRRLWLKGLAGCGKTVLSTTVLDHLTKLDISVFYFYFDFGDSTKQTFDAMLRSLAFQVHQAGTGPQHKACLERSFAAHQNGGSQPTTATLEELVGKALADQADPVILLDALDESTTRGELVRWIESMAGLEHVRMIFTSRPESDFDSIVPLIGEENCLPLDTVAVDQDIYAYVASRLATDVSFTSHNLSPDVAEEICNRVGNGAHGMFRWASCQMEALRACRTPAGIKKALGDLPRDLGETYERIIDKIPAQFVDDTKRLLHFLVHCKKPLKVEEAKDVIATQAETEPRGFDRLGRPSSHTITMYCPGMIAIVLGKDFFGHATQELHLAHFSVKEFLLKQDMFELRTARISIARTCLAYLTDIRGTLSQIEQEFPLAYRAARLWIDYAVKVEASDDLVQASLVFLQDEATFQRWVWLYDVEGGDLGFGSRLYYACLTGFAQAVDYFLDSTNLNAPIGRYGNALQAASTSGHLEIVHLLLDKGAEVNAQIGNYGNALQAASEFGHLEIVRLLLDKGAEVNAQGGFYGNALQAASEFGHLEIARLLLDKGAEVNAQGRYYGNALQAASASGYLEIVQLLLDKGAEVNAQGGRYGNALQAASESGHLVVAQLLRDKGAVNIERSTSPRSPPHETAEDPTAGNASQAGGPPLAGRGAQGSKRPASGAQEAGGAREDHEQSPDSRGEDGAPKFRRVASEETGAVLRIPSAHPYSG